MDKKPTIKELHKALRIDPNNLDEMMMEHPMLFWSVSEQYVLAASIRDEAKENISITDAKMNSKVRKAIEKEGEKVTEKLVEARINIDPSHIKSVQDHRDAKEKAELWFALKESYQSRGYMLREMASLYVSNYYSAESSGKGQDASAEYEHTKKTMAKKRKLKRNK